MHTHNPNIICISIAFKCNRIESDAIINMINLNGIKTKWGRGMEEKRHTTYPTLVCFHFSAFPLSKALESIEKIKTNELKFLQELLSDSINIWA